MKMKSQACAATVALATVLVIAAGRVAHTAAPPSGRAVAVQEVLDVVNENRIRIPPEGYVHYGFILRRGTDCTVSGRVVGVSGRKNDVEVLLLGAKEFSNWKQKPHAGETARVGYFHSARQQATTLDVAVSAPGEYNLVISNVFSLLRAKIVRANVELACAGTDETTASDSVVSELADPWAEIKLNRELSAAELNKLRSQMKATLHHLMIVQEVFFSDHATYSADVAKLYGFQVPARIRVSIREATRTGWFATAHVVGASDFACSIRVGTAGHGSPTANEREVACN